MYDRSLPLRRLYTPRRTSSRGLPRQMTHDMKLVEDDPGIRRVVNHRVPEGLPHIHGRKSSLIRALFFPPSALKNKSMSVYFATLTAHPDGTRPLQVADNDGDSYVPCGWRSHRHRWPEAPVAPPGRPALACRAYPEPSPYRGARRSISATALFGISRAQLAHMRRKTLGVARVVRQPV